MGKVGRIMFTIVVIPVYLFFISPSSVGVTEISSVTDKFVYIGYSIFLTLVFGFMLWFVWSVRRKDE